MTQQPPEQELSGGLVNYYLIPVMHPQREDQEPYVAEVDDLIRAMNMTFAEGCELKALVRTANARLSNGKPGQDAKYDAEKRVHYSTQDLKFYQLAETAKTETHHGGWIEWRNGNLVPHPDLNVEIQHLSGRREVGPVHKFIWGVGTSIVQYRMVCL